MGTDAVAAAWQPAEKWRRQHGRKGEAGNEASAQQGSDEAKRAHMRPWVYIYLYIYLYWFTNLDNLRRLGIGKFQQSSNLNLIQKLYIYCSIY